MDKTYLTEQPGTMTVFTEIGGHLTSKVYHSSLETLEETERHMVENGTDLTKGLFGAAKLLTEVIYGFANDADPSKARTLRLVLGAIKDRDLILAVNDNDPSITGVGVFMSPFNDVRAALITDIAIRPDAQRAGIGTALLSRIEDRVIAQRGQQIVLREHPGSNDPAKLRRFYEKNGYTVLGKNMYKRLDS